MTLDKARTTSPESVPTGVMVIGLPLIGPSPNVGSMDIVSSAWCCQAAGSAQLIAVDTVVAGPGAGAATRVVVAAMSAKVTDDLTMP